MQMLKHKKEANHCDPAQPLGCLCNTGFVWGRPCLFNGGILILVEVGILAMEKIHSVMKV
jgi:hypothetical protein